MGSGTTSGTTTGSGTISGTPMGNPGPVGKRYQITTPHQCRNPKRFVRIWKKSSQTVSGQCYEGATKGKVYDYKLQCPPDAPAYDAAVGMSVQNAANSKYATTIHTCYTPQPTAGDGAVSQLAFAPNMIAD